MAVEPKHLLTYEDFLTFPDDGVRREIVEGEVLVTPAPNIRHQVLVLRLVYALEEHVRALGGGRVFVSPLDVRLSEHDIVEPDVI
ncbi:MAG: Uma2 family endonuclease, partial [Actinomycetota bacterium]